MNSTDVVLRTPLDKIFQKPQAVLSAFFGVELNGKDIIPPHRTGKGDAVLGRSRHHRRISRLHAITVHKIKARAIGNPVPQDMRLLLHAVPAHVRHLEALAVGREDFEAVGADAADGAEMVQHTSMDEVYSDQSMWFADVEDRADDIMERESLKGALAKCIGELPEREALVLQLYFVEELNLEEIGQTLDIGAARVCQIKKSALDKLRGKLSDWN